MPWRELKPMDLKVMFIADYLSGRLNFSQLCAAHGSSRKTGYKWVARYNADSIHGLTECSRKRHSQAQAVPLPARRPIPMGASRA
nr:leucine zipper domain-containing protein [Pseudomonas moorei]